MGTSSFIDMSAQEEANKVKEFVVLGLVAEGYMTKEQADEFLGRYCVVLRGRSWFGRVFDRLRGTPAAGSFEYSLARVVLVHEGER